MQEELADKENEFEIVDFVKYNFNASVGFERAPPPLSATERDESEEAKPEEENEQVRIIEIYGTNHINLWFEFGPILINASSPWYNFY